MEEGEFHDFSKFELKLRRMIIDKMFSGDRMRFSGCSKLCNQEAKASKNYLYELFFKVQSDSQITILVLFTDIREEEEQKKFRESFISHNIDQNLWENLMSWPRSYGKPEMQFFQVFQWFGYFSRYHLNRESEFNTSQNPYELWRVETHKPNKIIKTAMEDFKVLLKTYQHTVRRLAINGWLLENIDLELDHFENLEDLVFFSETNYEQFLSKVRKPLRILEVYDSNISETFLRLDQVYQVRDNLFMPFAKLNRAQFFRISASSFDIHIGSLTEHDIFDFIKSWQVGTIGRQLKMCRWGLLYSRFDIRKLQELLRISIASPNGKCIKIKHEKEVGKFAVLRYERYELKFFEATDDQKCCDYSHAEENEEKEKKNVIKSKPVIVRCKSF